MNPRITALLAACSVTVGITAQNDIVGISWTGSTYSIDSNTGAGGLVGPVGFNTLNSMAAAAGNYYTVTNGGTVVSIDPVTGAGTGGATLATSLSVRGLATDPNGVVYAVTDTGIGNPDNLYVIDPLTGTTAFVGSTGFPGLQGLAIDASGQAWAWDVGSGNPVTGQGLITIDLATGAGTDVNPSIGQTVPLQCLAFSPTGTLYAGRNSLYVVDTTTGIETLVGGGAYSDLRGIEFTGSASASAYGAGCPGSFGTPALLPTTAPVLGSNFVLSASNLLPAATLAFMTIGLSDTTSILGPLPYNLAPFGLGASCDLWTSVDVSLLFGVSGGSGTFAFPVPAGASWAGFMVFFQAASIDAGAPGGIALSNAVAATFG